METASDVLRKNCKQNEEANKKCIDFLFLVLNGTVIYGSCYFVILFYAESCIKINNIVEGVK